MKSPHDLDTPEKIDAAVQRLEKRASAIQQLLAKKRAGEITHDEYVARYHAIPRAWEMTA